MLRHSTRRRPLLAGLLALSALLPACGTQREVPAAPPPAQLIELQQIFQMSQLRKKGNRPAAKSLQDFAPSARAYPDGFSALQKGDYVFDWASYADTSGDSGQKVLAYEKGAPSGGGYVLLKDGTVKTMTADEFRSAKTPG